MPHYYLRVIVIIFAGAVTTFHVLMLHFKAANFVSSTRRQRNDAREIVKQHGVEGAAVVFCRDNFVHANRYHRLYPFSPLYKMLKIRSRI